MGSFSFFNVDNVSHTSTLSTNTAGTVGLRGANDIVTLETPNGTFAIVSSRLSLRLTVFEIDDAGKLSLIDSLGDNSSRNFDGLREAAIVTLDDGGTERYFVYTVGETDDGFSVLELDANGSFVGLSQQNVSAASSVTDVNSNSVTPSALDGVANLTTHQVGGETYIYMVGHDDADLTSDAGGLSVWKIDTSLDNFGQLILVEQITVGLDKPWGTKSATVAGSDFLFVADRDGDKVTVYKIDGTTGKLTSELDINDDATNVLLDGARDLEVVELGGATYLYVTGEVDRGITVYSLDVVNGDLVATYKSNVLLSGAHHPENITYSQVNDEDYLFVSVPTNDLVQVYSIDDIDGSLTEVSSIGDPSNDDDGDILDANNDYERIYPNDDSDTWQLEYVRGLAVVDNFLIAPGFFDGGISVFEINTKAVSAVQQSNSDIDLTSVIDFSGLLATDSVVLTLEVSSGTFQASNIVNNVTATGNSTDTVTLTGTVQNIESYLSSATNLTYTGAQNVEGDDAANIAVRLVQSNNELYTATISINISSLSDPSVSRLPKDLSFTEEVKGNVDLSESVFSDGDATSVMTVTLTASSGTLDVSRIYSAPIIIYNIL